MKLSSVRILVAFITTILLCSITVISATQAERNSIASSPIRNIVRVIKGNDTLEYVKDEVLVRLKPQGNIDQFKSFLKSEGGIVIRPFDNHLFGKILFPNTANIFNKIHKIEKNNNVEYACINAIGHEHVVPNDQYFQNQWGSKRILMPFAWEFVKASNSDTIAILDSGADFGHNDLLNVAIPDTDLVENDNDPIDDRGHGTHVAGIAAAETNNSLFIAGIAWNAKLLIIKVNNQGYIEVEDLRDAFYHLVDKHPNVRIANFSGGYREDYPALQDGINYFHSHGGIAVVSAGNAKWSAAMNTLRYPARYPNTIAVGSTSYDGLRSDFSSCGEQLDIVAPGDSIISLMPRYHVSYNDMENGLFGRNYTMNYDYMSGTSMAAPFVSGLVCQILHQNPDLSFSEVKQILEQYSNDVAFKKRHGIIPPYTYEIAGPGWDRSTGYGQINPFKVFSSLTYNYTLANSNVYIENLQPGDELHWFTSSGRDVGIVTITNEKLEPYGIYHWNGECDDGVNYLELSYGINIFKYKINEGELHNYFLYYDEDIPSITDIFLADPTSLSMQVLDGEYPRVYISVWVFDDIGNLLRTEIFNETYFAGDLIFSLSKPVYEGNVLKIAAIDHAGNTNLENINCNFTIPEPTSFSAVPKSESSILLTWQDNTSGVAKYEVWRDGIPLPELVSESFFEDEGLERNQTYTYTVRAKIGSKYSEFSDPVSATTLQLSNPTNIDADILSINSVILTWQDNSSYEEGYELEWQKQGSGKIEIIILPPNTEEHIFTELEQYAEYHSKIRTFEGDYFTDQIETYITIDIPTTPLNFSLYLDHFNKLLRLSWSDISDNEDGFIVSKRRDDGTEYPPIYIQENLEQFEDENYEMNHIYFYKMKAFNVLGESEYTEEDSGGFFLVPPEDLKGHALSLNEVLLEWNEGNLSTMGYFRFHRKKYNEDENQWKWVGSASLDLTEFTDDSPGIVSNMIYNYKATTYDLYFGQSEFSNVTSVQIPLQGVCGGADNGRKIAMDSNANLHMVFENSDEVYYAKSSNNGFMWDEFYQVSAGNYEEGLSLTIDQNDNVHIVWATHDDIYYRNRSHNGNWGNEIRITGIESAYYGTRPSITVDLVGNIHAVWRVVEGYPSDPKWHLYWSYYIPGESYWEQPEKIYDNLRIEFCTPSIDCDPSGNIFVFFDYKDVFSNRKIGCTKKPLNQDWQFQPSVVIYGRNPCVVIDNEGNKHLVWYYFTNQSIYYCQVGHSSTKINDGSSIPITDAHPSISIDSYGTLNIVWRSENDIFYRYCLENGTWQSISNITNSPTQESRFPHLAPELLYRGAFLLWYEGIGINSCPLQYPLPPEKKEIVAYTSNPNPLAENNAFRFLYNSSQDMSYLSYFSDDKVYFSSFDGESWTEPEDLGNGEFPAMSFDSSENVNICWINVNEQDSTNELYYTRKTDSLWTQPTLIYSSDSSEIVGLSFTINTMDTAYLVWEENLSGDFWEYNIGKFALSDPVVFEKVTFDTGTTTVPQASPSIIADKKGTIHIVWDINGEIYYNHIENGEWAEKENISNSPDFVSNHPSINHMDDKIYVVWQEENDYGFGDVVFLMKYLNGNWSEMSNVSESEFLNSSNPIITNGLHVLWSEEIWGEKDIFLRRYNGIEWNETTNLTETPFLSDYPQAVILPTLGDSSDLYFVWTEGNVPPYQIISDRRKVSNLHFFSGHISENSIWDKDILITGDVMVDAGITLNINPGVTVYFCTDDNQESGIDTCRSELIIEGALHAEGTEDDSIRFTTISPSPTTSDWYGVRFLPSFDISSINYVSIKFATSGINYEGSYSSVLQNVSISNCETGINVEQTSPIIERISIFENWTGINCGPSSAPQIKKCDIFANTEYGIYSSSDYGIIIDSCNIFGNTEYGVCNSNMNVTIDADDCWWGDTTGPYDPSIDPPDYNPDGVGDKVSDYVGYRPWLESGPYVLVINGLVFEADSITPVGNPEVTITNISTDSKWVPKIEEGSNEYSHILTVGIDRDVDIDDIIRIMAKKNLRDGGDYDPEGYTYTINVTDTTVTQEDIDNGEINKDLYLNHYCINYYPDYHYFTQEQWNYSGAAVMQMWTDFKDVYPPYLQDSLQTLGLSNNTDADSLLTYIDPQGMANTLKDIIDLPPGHTFTVGVMPGDTQGLIWAMHRICWWQYTGPGALPTGGDYAHWMSVRGIHTDIRPQDGHHGGSQGEWGYDVYGFWINDPAGSPPTGLGANSYKTADEWISSYYTIITDEYNEEWNGKYITVLEPPEGDAKINIVSPKPRFNDQQRGQLRTLSVIGKIPKQIRDWIIQAAIDGVSEELIPYDENFEEVFETTIPGIPFFINSINGNNYYAVPFNIKSDGLPEVKPTSKDIFRIKSVSQIRSTLKVEPILETKPISDPEPISRPKPVSKKEPISKTKPIPKTRYTPIQAKAATRVVVLIDAEDGSFKEASWSDNPVKYLPVSRTDAQQIALEVAQEMGFEIKELHPELIHRHSTPYYPEWRVIIEEEGIVIYISQDGTVTIEDLQGGISGVMSAGVGNTPFIYSLKPISPNPFVNNAVINFSIAKPENVSINIYDVSGRLVKTIVNEKRDAGVYSERWNGRDNLNRRVAAGVYFTRLESGDFTSVKKVILVR